MNKFNRIKVRWAKKLLSARFFVILTDKESVIALEGADPKSFNDLLALTSQTAEITDYHDKLGELVGEHEQAVINLTGRKRASTTRKKTTTASNKRTVSKRV